MNQEIFSIRKDAVDLKALLFQGTIFRQGENWAALPREIVSNPSGTDSIIFELTRVSQVQKPKLLQIWFQATRPETLTLTLAPGITILMNGMMRGWEVSWGFGLLAMLGALLLQVAVNALNDVEDHLRLLDLIGRRGRSNGVIQRGWLSANRLQGFGFAALGIGVLFGIPAVLKYPALLIGVGSLGAFGVVAYSNRPFEIKYRALGELLIFFLMGPFLAIGFSEALFGRVDRSNLILGVFFGALAFGIFLGNNLKVFHSSPMQKSSTLVSRLGFRKSRHLFSAAYGLGLLAIGSGVVLGDLPLSAGLAVALVSPLIFKLLKNGYRASGPISPLLISVQQNATRIHFLMGLSLCLSFLITRLLFR